MMNSQTVPGFEVWDDIIFFPIMNDGAVLPLLKEVKEEAPFLGI